MTIIVWDGTMLAADRMTTRSQAAARGSVSKEHATSESTKLLLFPTKPMFGAGKLLAAGYSGSVEQFTHFHAKVFAALKKAEGAANVDFYDRVEIMAEMQIAIPEMSALYLTQADKGGLVVYTLEWMHRNRQSARATYHFTRHGSNVKTVAIGSGRLPTKVFSAAMNLTSPQYVHLATKYAHGCGHGMDLFQPGWDKLKRLDQLSAANKKYIAEQFAASL